MFTTSADAQANGKSDIVFKQGVTSQDINNTTSYEGDAISVGLSAGKIKDKPQATMSGLGYGTDSDSDSSITKGGVSGYNDPEGILTTENREALAGKLENVFDASRVTEELGAQTQITQAFDQERRKIKTEINKKEQDLRAEAERQGQLGNTTARDNLVDQADKVQNQGLLFDAISGAIYGPNSNGATGYVAKAASPFVSNQIGQYFKQNAADNKVDKGNRLEEGSSAHLLAHTILGAAVSYATGNDVLSGGIAAGTGEVTAPLLSQFLYETTDPSKLTAEQKDTISAITSALGAGIGATTGSASNAANAAETSKVAVEDNGLLEVIMPETMSNVVVDQNKAKALKQQAQLRKITTKGALTAGYAPYIVGGAVVAPSVYGSLGTAAKTAIGSGASGSAIDAATQKYECFNCNFNIKQNVGVAISSGITGYYGAGMANAAGTTHVTMGNIYKNTKNPTGLVIFGNQQLLNQAASKSIKSATENQTQKDQKK